MKLSGFIMTFIFPVLQSRVQTVLKNNPMALSGRNIDRYINNFTAFIGHWSITICFSHSGFVPNFKAGNIYCFFYLQAGFGNEGKEDFDVAMTNLLFILQI